MLNDRWAKEKKEWKRKVLRQNALWFVSLTAYGVIVAFATLAVFAFLFMVTLHMEYDLAQLNAALPTNPAVPMFYVAEGTLVALSEEDMAWVIPMLTPTSTLVPPQSATPTPTPAQSGTPGAPVPVWLMVPPEGATCFIWLSTEFETQSWGEPQMIGTPGRLAPGSGVEIVTIQGSWVQFQAWMPQVGANAVGWIYLPNLSLIPPCA